MVEISVFAELQHTSQQFHISSSNLFKGFIPCFDEFSLHSFFETIDQFTKFVDGGGVSKEGVTDLATSNNGIEVGNQFLFLLFVIALFSDLVPLMR